MGLRTMGVTTIDGNDDAKAGILYSSEDMRALPWIFESADDADAFVSRYGDVRRLEYAEQERIYEDWRTGERERHAAASERCAERLGYDLMTMGVGS